MNFQWMINCFTISSNHAVTHKNEYPLPSFEPWIARLFYKALLNDTINKGRSPHDGQHM
jgi:hypothetical protein